MNDPITDILRQGARDLSTAALEVEIETFLRKYRGIYDDKGYRRVVGNGYPGSSFGERCTGVGLSCWFTMEYHSYGN